MKNLNDLLENLKKEVSTDQKTQEESGKKIYEKIDELKL